MHDEKFASELQSSGRVSAQQVTQWRGVAGLMATLEAIGRDGASVVVKIDGARPDGAVYTGVVSGPYLGETSFRRDRSDLPDLLRAAVEFYRVTAW